MELCEEGSLPDCRSCSVGIDPKLQNQRMSMQNASRHFGFSPSLHCFVCDAARLILHNGIHCELPRLGALLISLVLLTQIETMTSSTPPWWSKDTVAVVTGGNKGIGYEIARQLAQQGVTVVLTARDPGRGQPAVDVLKKEGLESVWFHQLDVISSESVKALATWLTDQFGGIDILVNNAGITGGAVDYENAKEVLETNYYGVQRVTEGLMPVLRSSRPEGARILNNTSGLGLYERLGSEKLKQIFRDEENYTEELIDSLATKYLEDVKAGRWKEEGWVQGMASMYSDSKILMNAHSMAVAKSLTKTQSEQSKIFLVIFAPGVTVTDLLKSFTTGDPRGYKPPSGFRLKTPVEAADTPVWLAVMPREELASKHGKIHFDRKEYPFSREMKV